MPNQLPILAQRISIRQHLYNEGIIAWTGIFFFFFFFGHTLPTNGRGLVLPYWVLNRCRKCYHSLLPSTHSRFLDDVFSFLKGFGDGLNEWLIESLKYRSFQTLDRPFGPSPNFFYKREKTPIIIFIRNLLQYLLHFANSKTDFIWVPGHAVIPGNELADEMARSTPASAPTFSLLTHSYLIIHLKNNLTETWTTHFNSNISHTSIYYRIQPSIPSNPWFVDLPGFTRKSMVAICHFRFGHHCLPATLARFIPDLSPYTALFIPIPSP